MKNILILFCLFVIAFCKAQNNKTAYEADSFFTLKIDTNNYYYVDINNTALYYGVDKIILTLIQDMPLEPRCAVTFQLGNQLFQVNMLADSNNYFAYKTYGLKYSFWYISEKQNLIIK